MSRRLLCLLVTGLVLYVTACSACLAQTSGQSDRDVEEFGNTIRGALAELITDSTKAYRFNVGGLVSEDPNEIRIQLLTKSTGDVHAYVAGETHLGIAGFVFIDEPDQMLCDLNPEEASFCVIGLGFSRKPSDCSRHWEGYSIDMSGTVVGCRIQVLYGTGLNAEGVALFMNDNHGISYIGYLPTKEHVSGLGLSGVALINAEVRTTQRDNKRIDIELCPNIIVEPTDGTSSILEKLRCEVYIFDPTDLSLASLDKRFSKDSILMDVYYDEINELLGRRTKIGTKFKTWCRYIDVNHKKIFDQKCIMTRISSPSNCKDRLGIDGGYRLEFSSFSRITFDIDCPEKSKSINVVANGMPGTIERHEDGARAYYSLVTDEGEQFNFMTGTDEETESPWGRL